MNPALWLARTAIRTPEAPAIFHGTDLVLTYAGFDRAAAAIGAGLVSRGIGPGDRVAIFLPNCPEVLPILFGIWYAGATAVPINAKLHPKEVAFILGASGARLAFVREPEAHDVALPLIEPGSAAYGDLVATTPLPAPAVTAPDDTLWLFYTSGTTGKPKGACLSGANLAAMSLSYLADVDRVTAGDAALYAAPMSHGAGLYALVHVLMSARHVIPCSGGFDPAEIFALAVHHREVSMFAAPTMVKRMVAAARATGAGGDGIRTIVYGGGPMYVADIKAALDTFGPKFVQIYGQGEAPMSITALSRADIAERDHRDWERRLASVGRAQSVAAVAILSPEGDPLPTGEVGEIAVRGPIVMRGYLDAPEVNAKTIRDGWLMTGDIGRLDAEGYLTLHDRAKDMVVSGGTNIYPREVEEALLTHPGVTEVSVVGAPDPEWGEVVVAFVVGNATPEALDAHCLGQIARFKKPKRYVFVPELPKNNYGKVLKTELRAELERGA